MTLKNRGRSKKTKEQTGQKYKGGSLAVGTYLQIGSTPPPHHPDPGMALIVYVSDDRVF